MWDYIISHCCPSSIQDVFSGGMFKKDALTEFFDEVRQKCTFQYWFFGPLSQQYGDREKICHAI